MSTLTYVSDEHGTYVADEERVAEVLNVFYFRMPMDMAEVQEWFEINSGSPAFQYDEVLTRASFAIMIVSENLDGDLHREVARKAPVRRAHI
jgi:hypothetical protein